jgi:hypothetical protein
LSDKRGAPRNVPPPIHPSLSKAKLDKAETLSEKASSALAQGIVKFLLGENKPDDNLAGFPTAFQDPRTENIDPTAALLDTYSVQKGHFLILIKPQITLHSDVDSEATMLLAIESAVFRGFTVLDNECVGDPINSHVMHRYAPTKT